MWLRLPRRHSNTVLIVGLGNVGAEYIGTRHNVGFAAADALAAELQGTWREKKDFQAFVCEVPGKTKIVLAKPTTYMNRSGASVSVLKAFFKPKKIIVVADDVDLPFEEIRVRHKGGSAGHNGVQSVIDILGEEFTRVRIGIGRPKNPNIPTEDWVLGKWSEEEKARLPELLDHVVEQVRSLCSL